MDLLWAESLSCHHHVINTFEFIHSFIQAISIAPLQVHYYSEALPTQHGYFVGHGGSLVWSMDVDLRVMGLTTGLATT